MLPKLSIVTPSFNQAAYIEATIQSVLAQNYPRTEYLIIDGGSTDGTLDILPRYGRFLNWISEPDTGQANAINKGFRRSTGEIIGWLNSDDIYLPGALLRVGQFFEQHPATDLLYGDFWWIDPQGRKLLARREIPFDYNILLHGLNYIGQPTVFFRRQVFDWAGYLDETLHFGLDWEYWLRLASHGGKFTHIPRYLAATRWHKEAKTLAAPPEMFTEHQLIRDRYWNKRKFRSPRGHQLYAAWLNKFYRLKRQALKIILRRTIDFPPGHWVMYNQKR